MKVTVAIDSFKGSLTTFQAGEAARTGILRAYPCVHVKVCPIADGGEGTVDAVIGALNGERVGLTVCGPLGQPVKSGYGYVPDRGLAVIEMASAAGLTLVEEGGRDPLYTTTYGVGELIVDAIEKGCRSFLIGIGGSATNDGGIGMLEALGFEFLDIEGKPVPRGAIGLKYLARICKDKALSELSECTFRVACDVTNPLCGELGCSRIFAPQKGANPESVEWMDGWLKRYARLTKDVFPRSDPDFPGTGAAGGLGFAFLAYLGASLESGIGLVIKETGIEEFVRDSDVVITGEGRLDAQSSMGKAPSGIAALAKKHGKTVVALSGCVADGAEKCNENGIDAFFPILKAPCTLREAMDVESAYRNLSDTACQVFRLIKALGE